MDNKKIDLEKLKEKLFVDEKEESNIQEIVELYSTYIGKVSHDGHPILYPNLLHKLTRKGILKAQISGRVIAHILNNDIPSEIRIIDLIRWNEHLMPSNQIIARMRDLIKEGFILRLKRGVFKGQMYYTNLWIRKARRRFDKNE